MKLFTCGVNRGKKNSPKLDTGNAVVRLLNPVCKKGKERLLLEWTDAQKSVTSLKTNQQLQNRGAVSEQTSHELFRQ